MYLIKTERVIVSFILASNKLPRTGKSVVKYEWKTKLRVGKRLSTIFDLLISFCFYKWYGFFQILIHDSYKPKSYTVEEFKEILKNRRNENTTITNN